MKRLKNILRRLKPSSGVLLIIVAAVLIELTSVIMYWFARKGIIEEVEHRAQTELRVKGLEIQKVMVAVESAVNSCVWAIEQRLDEPDSLTNITSQLVLANEHIVGSGVVFTEGYYPEKGRWFEPYAAQRGLDSIEIAQIGGPEHDYLQSDWFREAIKAGRGYWSEPYYDEAGARMMLCSFFAPIHDAQGRIVAVIGADVSLDWLSTVINARHIYPSSYNIMISRTGQLMACPTDSLIMRSTIQEATAHIEDTTSRFINRQMLAGESGQATLKDEHGEKQYIFYAPVEGETGWSMAVVCNDKEIYGGLRQVGFYMLLMMTLGLLLMGYIVWRSVRNARRLQDTESQKAAISRELLIASDIQMALLPKSFPPYPDRKDIDIHASLVPAREVGGDLYDFHLRNEKLFFCIGDVSGKGVPASLVMAITRTLFRNVTAHESRPSRILSGINDTLAADNPEMLFVTFFVGVLDLPTGLLRYASAGHEAPILLGQGPLSCVSNLPLGTMPGWDYEQHETRLPDEATLFLYTDGLTEAMNADQTLFGKPRMMEALQALGDGSVSAPKTIIERMNQCVRTFVDGAEQSDDLTMLAIHYRREQTAASMERTLTLPNDVQTVPQLTAFVDEVCQVVGFDAATTMQMNLAVEEAVVNVMNYAYPKDTEGEVSIKAESNGERLKFTITDSGAPFDPTTHAEADTSLSAEERPIGGLGIHLIRHYMDSINYERLNNRNVLTLRKQLKQK